MRYALLVAMLLLGVTTVIAEDAPSVKKSINFEKPLATVIGQLVQEIDECFFDLDGDIRKLRDRVTALEKKNGCECTKPAAAVDGWHKGPPPDKTYNWGAVILAKDVGKLGFYFASFEGNSVRIQDTRGRWSVKIKNSDIAYWNNTITQPPTP